MVEAGWNEAGSGSGSIQDKILSCGSKLAGWGNNLLVQYHQKITARTRMRRLRGSREPHDVDVGLFKIYLWANI